MMFQKFILFTGKIKDCWISNIKKYSWEENNQIKNFSFSRIIY